MTTGMRRGEVVGLRWQDVDLDGRCLFIVQQITEVRGRSVVGTPKTRRGARVVPLDDGTVGRLRAHHEVQALERAAWDAGWHDSGLVFTREDGRSLCDPSTSPGTSRSSPTTPACRSSGSTTSGTPTRASHSPPASTSRSCRIGPGTRRRPSRPTSTPTSTATSAGRPPTASRTFWRPPTKQFLASSYRERPPTGQKGGAMKYRCR
jgi:Phage integrase family